MRNLAVPSKYDLRERMCTRRVRCGPINILLGDQRRNAVLTFDLDGYQSKEQDLERAHAGVPHPTADAIAICESRAGEKGSAPSPCCLMSVSTQYTRSIRSSLQETMPEAISPGLTDREAVLNSSAWAVEKRVCALSAYGLSEKFYRTYIAILKPCDTEH